MDASGMNPATAAAFEAPPADSAPIQFCPPLSIVHTAITNPVRELGTFRLDAMGLIKWHMVFLEASVGTVLQNQRLNRLGTSPPIESSILPVTDTGCPKLASEQVRSTPILPSWDVRAARWETGINCQVSGIAPMLMRP
ncbi:hypothetical protein P7C70_g6422, partial [Phenoliferia sp. Uapishka_3]